jgi:hypothetical protein
MGEIFVESAISNYFGNYELLPGRATNARVMFWIVPPLLRDRKEAFIDKVALVDQYGNSHWTDKIEFKSTDCS